MYINKCTKCGAEFETKNPKRVICPNCLYPDKKPTSDSGNNSNSEEQGQRQEKQLQYYSAGSEEAVPTRREYNNRQGGYNQNRGGYGQRQGGYNQNRGGYSQRQGGYNQNRGGHNRPSGFNKRPQQGGRPGGFNKRPQNGPPKRPKQAKPLLVSKEQVAIIEELYKKMLPLPNFDAHEVIGAQIDLEPKKVFFAINLIRQKMFLPKLPFPKRKLAVSPDQLVAIKNLYEPLLPLPPIGCHKLIAAQLRMDEWRVHVGIGIVRKQLGLERWNEGRPDAPQQETVSEEPKAKKTTSKAKKDVDEEGEEKPKKAGRKKKEDASEEA